MVRQNLWIVTELFPPDETSTAYIMGEIANAMTSKYNVSVICGPRIYDKRKKLDNASFQLHESVRVFRTKEVDFDKNTLAGKVCSFFLMSRMIIQLVKRYVKTGDKVLMVTNPPSILPLMARLKRRIGFELNILVHDIFPENTRPSDFRLPFYKIIKFVFDRAYNQADLLIALGRDMKTVLSEKISRFSNKTVSKPQIIIIENWADIQNIKPQPFPDGKIKIQYAGNIGRAQGLHKVIERLPSNVEFHIYGSGSMESKLDVSIYSNVFLHGPYLRSQQNEVLSECHIALVSLQDGMYGLGVPSKTYNILAAGRPILFLGPKNSEIYLLVKEYEIGYCEWPESWDKSVLIEMGDRARRLAELIYAKDKIINKFLNNI